MYTEIIHMYTNKYNTNNDSDVQDDKGSYSKTLLSELSPKNPYKKF